MGGGPQTKIDINDFENGGQAEGLSLEGSAREPSRQSAVFRMRGKAEKGATQGPKAGAQVTKMNFQK